MKKIAWRGQSYVPETLFKKLANAVRKDYCEFCKRKRGEHEENFVVHHVFKRTSIKRLLDFRYLCTLCHDCHILTFENGFTFQQMVDRGFRGGAIAIRDWQIKKFGQKYEDDLSLVQIIEAIESLIGKEI